MESSECGVDAFPINFRAYQFTESKDKGNPRYEKWNVFKLLSVVEKPVLNACISDDVFCNDPFINLLDTIYLEKVSQVGFNDHEYLVMGNLLYDNLVTIFKSAARQTLRD